ncbi:hypothetical protein [Hymenobacter rubidus]|uniref:hypothetical protein n=1 Tax=Hymenobacter rubidus TaxID=1441626 RepID=UPI00191F2473|nr:hypothetical protein [Hymenobacter rubidus]
MAAYFPHDEARCAVYFRVGLLQAPAAAKEKAEVKERYQKGTKKNVLLSAVEASLPQQ